MHGKKYIFLDRDGTIIVDKHYLSDPKGVELLPGAAPGLKAMQDVGYGLIIVTNQSGIGRGYFGLEDMHRVNARMAELLLEHGVRLDGLYYCPHGPDEACECRKPAPGMAQQAVSDLRFDPTQSVVIGDKLADLGLGRAIGAKTILVRTGKGAKCEEEAGDKADYVADDLEEAATWVMEKPGQVDPFE